MSFFISKELEGIITKETLYDVDDTHGVKIVNNSKDKKQKFDFLLFKTDIKKLKLSCKNLNLSQVITFFNDQDDYWIEHFSKKNHKQKIHINKIESRDDKIIVNMTLL